jgi:hypothetical protein
MPLNWQPFGTFFAFGILNLDVIYKFVSNFILNVVDIPLHVSKIFD